MRKGYNQYLHAHGAVQATWPPVEAAGAGQKPDLVKQNACLRARSTRQVTARSGHFRWQFISETISCAPCVVMRSPAFFLASPTASATSGFAALVLVACLTVLSIALVVTRANQQNQQNPRTAQIVSLLAHSPELDDCDSEDDELGQGSVGPAVAAQPVPARAPAIAGPSKRVTFLLDEPGELLIKWLLFLRGQTASFLQQVKVKF